jgi:hypothetical protein
MPQPAIRSRITIGGTTITYLPDGSGAHSPDVLFPGVDWTARPGHLEDGQLILSFGSFLIRAGDQKILVDLAVGKIDVDVPGVAHLKGGALLQNLAAEGLSTDDIDTVVYTLRRRSGPGPSGARPRAAATGHRDRCRALHGRRVRSCHVGGRRARVGSRRRRAVFPVTRPDLPSQVRPRRALRPTPIAEAPNAIGK